MFSPKFKLYTVATKPRPMIMAACSILEYLALELEILFVSNKEFTSLYGQGTADEQDCSLIAVEGGGSAVNEVKIKSIKDLMDYILRNNLWQHGAIKK